MQKGKNGGLIAGVVLVLGAALLVLLPKLSLTGIARLIWKLVLIAAIALAALVVLVVVLALHRPKEERKKGKAADAAQMRAREDERQLSEGRTQLTRLRLLGARIRNAALRANCASIFDAAERIFRELREHPEDLPRARSLFTYYLPLLETILTKYEYLERSRAPIGEMEEKVGECLEQMASALDRLYAGLFEDDVIDLSAEMRTLSALCRRDGLLEDAPQTLEGGE